MTAYTITDHTRQRAKELGVEVRPSRRKGKKIDVLRDGKVIASVGAIGYNDYPTYLALEEQGMAPKGTAKKRQRAFKQRFEKTRRVKESNAWWADRLLW